MPKEEWGTKRICPTTGKRFFDMNRNPIVSPYTGEVVVIETTKSGRMVAERARPKVEAEDTAEEDVVLEDEDEADVDLPEDEVLEDDDDDDTVSLDELGEVGGDDEES